MTGDPILKAWNAVREQEEACPSRTELTLAALSGPEALPALRAGHLLNGRCPSCEPELARLWAQRPPSTDLIAVARTWPANGAMRIVLQAQQGVVAEPKAGPESEPEPARKQHIPLRERALRRFNELVGGISEWKFLDFGQDRLVPQFNSGLGVPSGPSRGSASPGVFGPVVLRPVDGDSGKVLVKLSRDRFPNERPQGEVLVYIYSGGKEIQDVVVVRFAKSSEIQEQTIEMDSGLIASPQLAVQLAVEPT